ncbi:hypothetical protein LB562_28470 [Mesorhizobium sp. B263B1A]|uniref:hypothetical protein n=1 Tax=Mesorhizobium sp. B263B1A TaxID=2876670 RepID=UPI001CD16BA4|nr:hypothetical protein [Mesorhizobium sp. B263B1A]MCA0028410.1 hypothetical protein [Mesorhizobium sp. B263B1A]
MPQNGFGGRRANAWKYLALTSTALVGLGQPIAATAADAWTGTTSTDWLPPETGTLGQCRRRPILYISAIRHRIRLLSTLATLLPTIFTLAL